MRITILANQEFASLYALRLLLPQLAGHSVTVFYTRKQNAPKNNSLTELAAYDAKQLLASQSQFQAWDAQELNHINTHDFERYRDSKPDLVLSIRHMSILQASAIAVPALGVMNLHSGILPDYQGVMATFWAMKNREAKIGTTLHWVDDAKIDKGRIISINTQAADYQRSYYWNVLTLYQAGCNKMASTVNSLAKGKAPAAHSQADHGNYYSWPTEGDIKAADVPLFSVDEGSPN